MPTTRSEFCSGNKVISIRRLANCRRRFRTSLTMQRRITRWARFSSSRENCRKLRRRCGKRSGCSRILQGRIRPWPRCCGRLGDAQGAAEEAKAGANIAASSNNLQSATFATNSGKRLLGAGDMDGAIAQFRSAISSEPNYAAAHYQLGLALQQQGQRMKRRRNFRGRRNWIRILTAPRK